MGLNEGELQEMFRRLGIRAGDLVTAHSSFKRIGPVDGGPGTVLKALLQTVGPTGTVIFPSFTFSLAATNDPLWIYEETPSCVGILSELFRQQYGEYRSIHFTHSFSARGPLSRELTAHPLEMTPCGWESPLGKFLRRNGKILMIGVSLNTCTAIHVIEEHCRVPYVEFVPRPDARYQKEGVIRPLPSFGVKPFTYDFERLRQPLINGRALNSGKLGTAETLLIDGGGLLEIGDRLLRRNPVLLHAEPSD